MKKGIVPLWISLFFGALAVVLLLAFYFVFVDSAKQAAVVAAKESGTTMAHTLLASYLNAPVIFKEETITFADLIRLVRRDVHGEAAMLLEPETKKFLISAGYQYRDVVINRQSESSFVLLIYDKPPGNRGDQWLCVDALPAESIGGCRDPSGYLEASDWDSKATTLLPVSDTTTLFVVMLMGSRQ